MSDPQLDSCSRAGWIEDTLGLPTFFVSRVEQGGELWFQFTCISCLPNWGKKWAVISVRLWLFFFFQSAAKKWTKNWAVPPDLCVSPPPTTKVKDGKNKKVNQTKPPKQISSFKAIYDGCDDEEEIRRRGFFLVLLGEQYYLFLSTLVPYVSSKYPGTKV